MVCEINMRNILNDIRIAKGTVPIADIERKQKELLRKVLEESQKKRRNINSKMTKCMIVSKRYHLTSKLRIGDNKIKQV